MPRLQPILFTLVLLGVGCSGPTETDSFSLTGHWVTAPEDLGPGAWYQTHLLLDRRGLVVVDVRSYGHYGRPRDELTGYSRIQGIYRIEGDRLLFTPRRLAQWDRFYGADSPEHTQEPYHGPLFDEARYVLGAGQLTIDYITYPFDAPVATSAQFTRVK